MTKESSALETQWINTADVQRLAVQLSTEHRDLGLGPELGTKYGQRLLNRDGSFNAKRFGTAFFRTKSLYHWALNTSFAKFIAVLCGYYFGINILFAIFFFTLGPDALQGVKHRSGLGLLLEDFFFSIQTSATIGYGVISPASIGAHLLVSVEALVSLLSFALATGVLFARFSRPTARLVFTPQALIAPFKEGFSFQFRIANERANQMFNLSARVTMSRLERDGNGVKRRFYDLAIDRKEIMFFPLQWTIVHPITDDSPLFCVTERDLYESDAEFLVLISGTDDTFSQTVYSWTSYKPHEIIWGAKWKNIYESQPGGNVAIRIDRLGEYEKAQAV